MFFSLSLVYFALLVTILWFSQLFPTDHMKASSQHAHLKQMLLNGHYDYERSEVFISSGSGLLFSLIVRAGHVVGNALVFFSFYFYLY